MINNMLSRLAEQRRRRMQIDRRLLDERLVPFLRIFARGVAEESRAERLSYTRGVAAAGDDFQLVPVEDLDELFTHVFGAAHALGLDEVLETPRV